MVDRCQACVATVNIADALQVGVDLFAHDLAQKPVDFFRLDVDVDGVPQKMHSPAVADAPIVSRATLGQLLDNRSGRAFCLVMLPEPQDAPPCGLKLLSRFSIA